MIYRLLLVAATAIDWTCHSLPKTTKSKRCSHLKHSIGHRCLSNLPSFTSKGAGHTRAVSLSCKCPVQWALASLLISPTARHLPPYQIGHLLATLSLLLLVPFPLERCQLDLPYASCAAALLIAPTYPAALSGQRGQLVDAV